MKMGRHAEASSTATMRTLTPRRRRWPAPRSRMMSVWRRRLPGTFRADIAYDAALRLIAANDTGMEDYK